MTLQCYIKTEQGVAELQQRQLALNPKQRRVLLLIDNPAFLQLNPTQQQRWMCEQTINELSALNLITVQTAQNITPNAEKRQYFRQTVKSNESHESERKMNNTASKAIMPRGAKTAIQPSDKNKAGERQPKEKTAQRSLVQAVQFKVLSFAQIQNFMIDSLQQFCGLMAKPLIEQIKQARSMSELKQCQIQWLTHLQESRMSPVQLSFSCQQLNFAMNAL